MPFDFPRQPNIMTVPDLLLPAGAVPHSTSDAAAGQFALGLGAAIAYFRVDRLCAFGNHAYARFYGLEPAQLTGKTVAQIIGPDAWASVSHHVEAAFAGQHASYQRATLTPGQPERWLEVHLVPRRNKKAELSGVIVFVNDISKRTMGERKLEAAWQRLERFSQATREGIAFYKSGVLIDCNEALSNMLGRPREELIGKNVVEFFPADHQSKATHHIHLNRDTPYPAKLVRPDGSTLDVEITGRLAHWDSRDVHVACVLDMSRLKRMGESLVSSEARYRALVEHAREAIVFSQNRVITYANPAAATLFELPVSELVGTPTPWLAHPDDREMALANYRLRMVGSEAFEARIVCPMVRGNEAMAPNARIKPVMVSGTVLDWEGSSASFIFMTDVSLEKASRDQLTKALQQERELGELKTRFVSMASHEFRTPLATIQTASELLQHYQDRLKPEEREEAIADIQLSVQRMQGMIDNFLTLGRMSVDAMRFAPSDLAVVDCLRGVVGEAVNVDRQQHLVMLDVSPQVPMAQLLVLDEVLLRQIVGNLLGNACKYSDSGTTVWLRLNRLQDTGQLWLTIDVADSGIGIPQSDMPHLFETFHRASNTGEVRGTGLGLAIVKRAVEAHGGIIKVQSQAGVGSTFSVRLPWQERGA